MTFRKTGATAAANATQRITLGTAVAIAFPRSPMVVANAAWDLQETSRGRFTLGLGSQGQSPRALDDLSLVEWGDLDATAELIRTRRAHDDFTAWLTPWCRPPNAASFPGANDGQ